MRTSIARLIAACGLLIGALALGTAVAPAPVRAAGGTYYVGSMSGRPVSVGADDRGCTAPANATCTLRGALAQNATDGGGGTVRFGSAIPAAPAQSTITLTDGGGGTIALATSVTIDGTGKRVAISGGNAVGVFLINYRATVILTALTITGGNSGADGGGGIDNVGGTVTLMSSTVSGNSATGGFGGGIHSLGVPVGNGGVVCCGYMTLVNSTVSGNSATFGGGLFNNGASSMTLVNSTVSGNTDGGSGSGNIYYANSVEIDNTIIAGGATGSSYVYPSNSLLVDNPLLAPLGYHGGSTDTMPPLLGSPAVDAGDSATCAARAGNVDQRGLPRPATVCAIGAYEPQPSALTAVAGTPQSTALGAAFATNLAAKVADDQGNPLPGWSVTFAVPPPGPSGTFATSAVVTTDSGGVATAPPFTADTVAGAYTVTANVSPALGTPASFALTNRPGAATALTVSGYPSSVLSGTAHPFTVTAVDQYGNPATGYTGTVHVTSTDTHAALPADYPFVAGDAGAHSFSATFGTAGVQSLTATDTATSTITGTQAGIAVVTIATTTTLAVAPAPAVHGATVTLTATVAAVAPTSGAIRPASPLAPGGTVTFADGGAPLATVGLVGGTAAFATGTLGVGTHHLSATYNPTVPGPYATSQGTQDETITAAALVSIAVTPATATLKVGQVQPFTATGTYADSSTADLTSQVTWASDAPGVVGVDTTGTGTGKVAGTAHISATQGGVSAQATVAVTPPVLTGVQPAPAPASRPSGASVSGTAIPAPAPNVPPVTGGGAPVAAPGGRP